MDNYEKAYKEALERAKKGMPINEVFPELKESEDEIARKEIIDYLNFAESHNLLRAADYEKKKGWLAYLEKQKEHQNNSDAPNEISWGGIISSSDKDSNLDELAQDYIDGVRQYNPTPTWDLMQTAVCYGYHLGVNHQVLDDEHLLSAIQVQFASRAKVENGKRYAKLTWDEFKKIVYELCSRGKQKEQKPIGTDFRTAVKNLMNLHKIKNKFTEEDYDFHAKELLELVEQKSADNVSKEEYVKRFKALCDAYEIKLPNREYDIYHLCDDLSKLSIDSDEQKPTVSWTIQDAHPGDILNSARVQATIIFKGFNPDGKHIDAYCALQKGIFIAQEMLWDRDFEPATQVWKDAIFDAMVRKGYLWDAENKRLNKAIQQPAEWSEEDEKKLSVISYKISQHQGNDERSLFTPDEAEFIGRLEDKLKSLLPQPHTVSIKDATKFGNLEYERGVKDGIQSEKSRHWKPSEYILSLVKKVADGEMLTGVEQMAIGTLYEQLKSL